MSFNCGDIAAYSGDPSKVGYCLILQKWVSVEDPDNPFHVYDILIGTEKINSVHEFHFHKTLEEAREAQQILKIGLHAHLFAKCPICQGRPRSVSFGPDF